MKVLLRLAWAEVSSVAKWFAQRSECIISNSTHIAVSFDNIIHLTFCVVEWSSLLVAKARAGIQVRHHLQPDWRLGTCRFKALGIKCSNWLPRRGRIPVKVPELLQRSGALAIFSATGFAAFLWQLHIADDMLHNIDIGYRKSLSRNFLSVSTCVHLEKTELVSCLIMHWTCQA